MEVRSSPVLRITLFVLLAAVAAPAQDDAADRAFGPAEAEHLLNRAGFGGPPEEIARLVALGREAAVRSLMTPGLDAAPQPEFRKPDAARPSRTALQGLSAEERKKAVNAARQADRRQMAEYRGWWIDRMVRSPAPLAEKMTLFWHGHFTSSFADVKNSAHLIRQNQVLREHALGGFRALLHAASKDPAMLEYLDNNKNLKGNPNENFAREVMELFTLGPGNYTEQDIKEAARAFTGWTFRGDGFVFNRRAHDNGMKTVLGRTGRFSGDDVLDILLDQDAAPRHLASRLLAFFAGPETPPEMVARYGELVRRHDYAIRPVLEALLNDPGFYRPELMGSRIVSPVELVVALSRRLGEKPPGELLAAAASHLGQTLFDPPNVKGWEGDAAWITTASFLARGNLAGYLAEGLTPERLRADFGDGSGRSFRDFPVRAKWIPATKFRSLVERAGTAAPADLVDLLCDRLLGVPVTAEARASLAGYLGDGVDGALPSEFKLKKLVRIILSLPEAQLG